MAVLEETIDIAVIGAGHAGCEAALAAARMGLETVVFTVSRQHRDDAVQSEHRRNLEGTPRKRARRARRRDG